jgi:hypothetical protein
MSPKVSVQIDMICKERNVDMLQKAFQYAENQVFIIHKKIVLV